MSNEVLDVAIVGAGAAGTYTAWRLANDESQDASKVKIFDFLKIDGKAHVGGRLWSTHLPGLGYTRKAEVGGMRFLSSQKIVVNILPQLNLTSVPFDVDSKNNLFNLRSKVLRTSEITDPTKVPFNLAPLEQGMSPGGLLLYAVETVVPNAPYLTPEEWVDIKKNFKVDGYHLYEIGFWNLLQRILSEEGYQYVYAGQGYNTIPSNWNAADAMQWILEDFAADVSYQYVKEGYQCVPEKLLEGAMDKGVEFHKSSKLKSWRKAEDGIIDLKFESTVAGEDCFSVRTKKLVLAVPKKSLELIDMPTGHGTEKFHNELLPAVEPQPMFKFFLGYKYPWWRTLGMTSGRTITDNPLRQIYYWGSNYQRFFDEGVPEETKGEKNDPENSVLMVYLDGRDVSFWQPLFEFLNIHGEMLNVNSENEFDVLKVHSANLKDFLSDLKVELSDELYLLENDSSNKSAVIDLLKKSKTLNDKKLENISRSQEALNNLLNTISVLLMRAHGIQFIPDPYTFAYADWTANPFGGAYNLWKPGYKSWEVTKDIIKPFSETEAYIVGEAYSVKQGWVEGALETSEQMLQNHFKLSKPIWLSKSYKFD